MATTANNKEVCSTRRLDQCWSGMALDDHGFELYPVKGTPYLFDSVFEHLVGVGFGVVIIRKDIAVTVGIWPLPRHHHRKCRSRQVCLLCRPLQRGDRAL